MVKGSVVIPGESSMSSSEVHSECSAHLTPEVSQPSHCRVSATVSLGGSSPHTPRHTSFGNCSSNTRSTESSYHSADDMVVVHIDFSTGVA